MTGGRTSDIIFSVNPRKDDEQESQERRGAACSPCCKRGAAIAIILAFVVAIAVGLGVGLKPPPAPVTYTATVRAACARGVVAASGGPRATPNSGALCPLTTRNSTRVTLRLAPPRR